MSVAFNRALHQALGIRKQAPARSARPKFKHMDEQTIWQVWVLHCQGFSNAAIGRALGYTAEPIRLQLKRLQSP